MKTIEQAATNAYSIEVLSSNCNAGVTFGKEMFKLGVEFAQRWIPIEEELPEKNIDILLKCDNDTTVIGFLNEYKVFQTDRPKTQFTHWRPINYK